jgi:predicted nucleic acid-binding protein
MWHRSASTGGTPTTDTHLTDCTSFIIMRELRISDVLTTDEHFTEAGFEVLS